MYCPTSSVNSIACYKCLVCDVEMFYYIFVYNC